LHVFAPFPLDVPADARVARSGKRFLNIETTAVSHDAEFDPSTIPSSNSEAFLVPLRKESFHAHRCDGPDPSVSVSKDDMIWMYRNMVQMRKHLALFTSRHLKLLTGRMEQAADALYKQKLIRGFCHLAIGQEAVSIGMESAIEKDDKVITAYRCHPFAVMRGGTIKGVIAELLGRKDGMSHGKGGSMSVFLDFLLRRCRHQRAGTSLPSRSLAETALWALKSPLELVSLSPKSTSKRTTSSQSWPLERL
jgi:hypothetical protein